MAVSNIGDCILTADNSKAIEPVSVASYTELKRVGGGRRCDSELHRN